MPITTGSSYVFAVGPTPLTDTSNISGITLEVGEVDTLESTSDSETVTVTTRGKTTDPGYTGRGRTQSIGGSLSRSLSVNVAYDPSEASIQLIEDAHNSQDEIAFYALNGPASTSGSRGWVGNAFISNFSKSESNGEAVTASFTVSPGAVFVHNFVVA